MATKKTLRRSKIKRRVRKKVVGTTECPRLSVFKSNAALYAQLIDDTKGHTLAHACSKELSDKKNFNVQTATEVGKKIAERAKDAGFENVVFDRNGYRYHGRVKAMAEAAREGGLKF